MSLVDDGVDEVLGDSIRSPWKKHDADDVLLSACWLGRELRVIERRVPL